jgi:hypothetical protein
MSWLEIVGIALAVIAVLIAAVCYVAWRTVTKDI